MTSTTPHPVVQLDTLLQRSAPILALAPMQDVTDLPFWRLMHEYGGPDIYFTEYFRVSPGYKPERSILRSLDENPTGRPAVAQMIGNDISALINCVKALENSPIAAIDFNLGCPAPVVYKKCAGGGLLRDLPRIDSILGALRDAISVRFTVKTRLGFDNCHDFEKLLTILAKHRPDLVTVHGRTVREMYGNHVHYDLIANAVEVLPCPVLANGNVTSTTDAQSILNQTRAAGLMIGRGAIRNPWIFSQIRAHQSNQPVILPTGHQVLAYIHSLHDSVCNHNIPEAPQVHKLKKYLNFLGLGVDPGHQFLHAIRRTSDLSSFWTICEHYLTHSHPMPLSPFPLPLKTPLGSDR